MASAKDQAQKLSQEIRDAVRTIRKANARARSAAEEFKVLLIQVQREAEAARNVVEYPSGRYECSACHQPVIFAETQSVLPPCDGCGRSAGYDGPPPIVLEVVPDAPRKFAAGLYACKKCHTPLALVEGADVLAPCEACGANEFIQA